MRKMNKQINYKALFWIAISIIILLLTINITSKMISNAYNQGVQDGQLNLISQIQQTGNIPYFTNETGNLTIKTISIKELCLGVQNG